MNKQKEIEDKIKEIEETILHFAKQSDPNRIRVSREILLEYLKYAKNYCIRRHAEEGAK